MAPMNVTSDMSDDTPVDSIKLDTDIYLISIKKHYWSGEHVLDDRAKARVEVKGQTVDSDLLKKSTVLLIPKKLRSVLTPGYSAVDSVIIRYTTNFTGARALAAASKAAFFKDLKEARAILDECVESFVERYPDEVIEYNKARWEKTLGDDYPLFIGRLIPSADAVGSRYGYSVRDIRRLEAPSAEYKALLKLDKEMLAEVRKNKRADYEAAMDELVSGPRLTLASAMDDLIKQLSAGKILKRGSFNGVLDAIALNRAFAGTITDAKLLAAATALEKKIGEAIEDAETNVSSTQTWSDLLWKHKATLTEAIGPVAEATKDSAAVEQVRRHLNARVRPVDV
jgi:hypothetical protein